MPKESYVIFGTVTCGYCTNAKEILETAGIDYNYTNIHSLNESEKENLMSIAGQRFQTVPQIFKRGQDGLVYVGGFKELKDTIGL